MSSQFCFPDKAADESIRQIIKTTRKCHPVYTHFTFFVTDHVSILDWYRSAGILYWTPHEM